MRMDPDELRFWDMVCLAHVVGGARSNSVPRLAADAANLADALVLERRKRASAEEADDHETT
jgi:hypothetical protein